MSIYQRSETLRSRALLESPSTKHAKNVTRTNHSARRARGKLKDCIYKLKMRSHIYSLSGCFWFGFSTHLILTRAFTEQVPLFSTSLQLGTIFQKTKLVSFIADWLNKDRQWKYTPDTYIAYHFLYFFSLSSSTKVVLIGHFHS